MTTTRIRKVLAAALNSELFVIALNLLLATAVFLLFGTQMEALAAEVHASIKSTIEILIGVKS